MQPITICLPRHGASRQRLLRSVQWGRVQELHPRVGEATMNILSKVCVCDDWYFVQSRAGLVQHLCLWLWFFNVSVFFIVSLLSRGLVWFNISQDNAGGWRNEEITNAIKVSNNQAILIPLWDDCYGDHCGTLMKLNISCSPRLKVVTNQEELIHCC